MGQSKLGPVLRFLAIALLGCSSAGVAGAGEINDRMSIVEAIESVREHGFAVSYSSLLVEPWMRVRFTPEDTDPLHSIHKICHFLGRFTLEQGAIDCDPEAALESNADYVFAFLVDAIAAYGGIVAFTVTVEVDRKRQVRRRFVIVHATIEQQRVGAQIHKFLAPDIAANDARHVFMDQRFAAGDRYDRCAALVDRFHTVFIAQPLVENFFGVIDLAAAGAGEVATEKRFQHQYERILFDSPDLLPEYVSSNADLLDQWNAHALPL